MNILCFYVMFHFVLLNWLYQCFHDKTFGGDGFVHVYVCQIYQIIHFIYVWFIVCQSHLNKIA